MSKQKHNIQQVGNLIELTVNYQQYLIEDTLDNHDKAARLMESLKNIEEILDAGACNIVPVGSDRITTMFEGVVYIIKTKFVKPE